MKKFRLFISRITFFIFGILFAKNKEEAKEFQIEIENDEPYMN